MPAPVRSEAESGRCLFCQVRGPVSWWSWTHVPQSTHGRVITLSDPLRLRGFVLVLVAAVLMLSGCAASEGNKPAVSPKPAASKGKGMSGPAQKIAITRETIRDTPEEWTLTTPESAVRSYLDWVSYAYRTANSAAATATMSAKQEVRVDSYLQLNVQKSQLIDQRLMSITFGTPTTGATSASVPVRESWSYRYVSISEAGKTLAGPYTVEYDNVYTCIKKPTGEWVVDTVKIKALGEVK